MTQNPEQQYPPPQQPYSPQQYPQPPQYPQGQQYYAGGMPPAPPLSTAETAAAVRPKAVDTSVLLWLVAAGISLLSNVLSLITADAVTQEVAERSGVSLQASEPGSGGTIFSLVLLVAWVATVFAMRNGQNWARILLTVLGGIYLLIALFGLLALGILFAIGALGVVQGLLSLVSIGVVIAALVFQFKAESNRYFKHS